MSSRDKLTELLSSITAESKLPTAAGITSQSTDRITSPLQTPTIKSCFLPEPKITLSPSLPFSGFYLYLYRSPEASFASLILINVHPSHLSLGISTIFFPPFNYFSLLLNFFGHSSPGKPYDYNIITYILQNCPQTQLFTT